jgi:hypothetical protein
MFAVAAMGALLAFTATASANVRGPFPITKVSHDPFTNTTAYHQTEVEPDTFAWGSTIVGVFQTGRFSNGGSDDTGWATSTDGGAHWSHGFMPGMTPYSNPTGPYARVSDPSVAYDPKHDVWLGESLTVDTKDLVIVNRSTDGGLTWSNPVVVSTPGSGDYDKTWIACDTWSQSPNYGTCYSEVDDYVNGDTITMSRSTDGGKTWKTVTVSAAHGLGGQPLAQPNGNLIVPFWADAGQIQSIVSKDGGKTFSGPYTISSQTDHGVAFIRTEPLPSAEIDAAGKVYVVWQDCRFRTNCTSNDIVMSTSSDGKNWSAVVRIPIDPVKGTDDHFIPGIGVDPGTSGSSAHLALTFYAYPQAQCTFDTCRIYAEYVTSTDGGATWTPPLPVLPAPLKLKWLPSAGGRFLGDYISTSISGGRVFPVIANAKKGTGGSCTLGQITSCKEYMISPTNGLPMADGTVPIGPELPVPGARSDHPLNPHPRAF